MGGQRVKSDHWRYSVNDLPRAHLSPRSFLQLYLQNPRRIGRGGGAHSHADIVADGLWLGRKLRMRRKELSARVFNVLIITSRGSNARTHTQVHTLRFVTPQSLRQSKTTDAVVRNLLHTIDQLVRHSTRRWLTDQRGLVPRSQTADPRKQHKRGYGVQSACARATASQSDRLS